MASLTLSPQLLSDYGRDGFVIVRGLYGVDEVNALREWADELAHRPPERGKLMAYYEDNLAKKGDRILSRVEKFLEYHENFHKFVYDEKLMGLVKHLLGGPAVVFKEKINYKLPGGDGFKPHQDIQPGWDDYVDFFLSVLVTIDESNEENGCLELAAGHHQRGWIGRRGAPLEGDELKGLDFKKYPMQPGDVALFDCYVPHQSAPNRTGFPRRNLYITFNRAEKGDHREQYFADKRRSFPPDFERNPGQVYTFKV